MENQSIVQSPDVPAIAHRSHLGGPVVPLPLRRVETFELDDEDCAQETYEHWCSLPTFLEAKMYLCPISEIITVTAFFAQTLPPGTVIGLRKGYFQLGEYPFFSDESVVLAANTQHKRRKKAKAKSQGSAIKQFSGRLEVVF